MQDEVFPPWENLPLDILLAVARLAGVEATCCMIATCRSWRRDLQGALNDDEWQVRGTLEGRPRRAASAALFRYVRLTTYHRGLSSGSGGTRAISRTRIGHGETVTSGTCR